MQESFAHIQHPLSRDGLSQQDRLNEKLDTASAPVDGRELSDLLRYLYEYARQVNYYKESHEFRSGDWIPFFQQSIPFQYALIGGFDLNNFENRLEEIGRSIERRLSFSSLNLLFDLILETARNLEQWLSALSEDTSGLKIAIESLIDTNLRSRMRKLIGLANAAGKWGYQYPKDANALARYWGLSLPEIYAVDAAILSLRGSQKYKVLEAKKILEELYRTFWKGLQAIVELANDEEQLLKSLENEGQQDHEPHLGLVFAFLLLFKELQGSLNGLSDAHLDFFYRRTLQLKEQPYLADNAHLVFELAKKVEEDILIEKGTRLKAGKDNNGEDIYFELDEELILTKAKVGSLRTLFIEQGKSAAFIPDSLSGVYAALVANSADGQGEKFPKGQPPSWETVGSRPSKWTDPESGEIVNHPFARLGFIAASKVLFLREGKRKVRASFAAAADCSPPAAISAYFDVYLSTEEGWTLVPNIDVVSGEQAPVEATIDPTGFTIEFMLQPDFLPVIYPGADVLETDYGYSQPMMKLELNQEYTAGIDPATFESPYYWLRLMKISSITIDAWVCDVRNLVVQNDQALVDVNKPFYPFGVLPKKNSSYFWIGNEEIFCKNWQSIDVNMLWKDKPANFADHYEGYPPPLPQEGDYEASVELLSEKNWIPGNNGNLELFSNTGARIQRDGQDCCPPNNNSIVYGHVERSWFTGSQPCPVPASILNGYSNDMKCGFLRLKLGNEDFRHGDYQKAITESFLKLAELPELKEKIEDLEANNNSLESYAITTDARVHANYDLDDIDNYSELARILAIQSEDLSNDALSIISQITNPDGEFVFPNEPYTPLLESLSLDYHALASTADGDISFAHLYPWEGAYENFGSTLAPAHSDNDPTILPCFIDEGALYIGLEQYEAGSKVNLYFQMEPASADPDTDKAIVCWEYLRNNRWKPLRPDSEVLADSTKGFIQSGIVELAVPPDISTVYTTILPPQYHWLKARVLLRTPAIAESLEVHTQAAKAVFAPEGSNDLTRLAQPLDAGLVAKLAAPKAAVKGVVQPFPGFGGRPEEPTSSFNRRISEYLRHKGRAISLYDYEHLVLQAFPEVYKVKCITHTLGRRGQDMDYEMCPGFVTLVVVPDLEKVNAVDVYQPKVPANTLQAIKDFLKPRMSPFIRLEVLNPKYEEISVKAKVQFLPGKSINFYLERLEEEVQEFLAPWVSSGHRADISFGGQVYYSLVLDFIENRKYVDYVLELSIAKDGGPASRVVSAEGSRAVLTTAKTHQLRIPEEEDLIQSARLSSGSGIGFDIIPE